MRHVLLHTEAALIQCLVKTETQTCLSFTSFLSRLFTLSTNPGCRGPHVQHMCDPGKHPLTFSFCSCLLLTSVPPPLCASPLCPAAPTTSSAGSVQAGGLACPAEPHSAARRLGGKNRLTLLPSALPLRPHPSPLPVEALGDVTQACSVIHLFMLDNNEACGISPTTSGDF